MSSEGDAVEYRFSVAPDENPASSTAFEGYLWKVKAEEGLYYITDLDEIAETEIDRGREVTIIDIKGRDVPKSFSKLE